MPFDPDRRRCTAFAGAVLIGLGSSSLELRAAESASEGGEKGEMEVPAVEDLMREHGVLRRSLLVYSEAASRLARGAGDVPVDSLGKTAALFRSFGEDYHERALEEQHVFVPLIKGGGKHAALAKTLTAQHQRGREITDYITAVARKGRIATADTREVATTLAAFVRRYEHHAAIEDTIVFPAWKQAISPAEYRELTEKFEDLEHRMFGKDGFEDALGRIAAIEQAFGLADLNALTPPAPPKIA